MAKQTICHVELQVTDLANSQAFFGSIFDWQFRSFGTEMVVFGAGETHVGGLNKVPSVVPANYAVAWFDVDDIDASLGAVTAAGGVIKNPKHPVPNVGWSAEFTDLDGNPVGIVQFDRS